MISKEKLEKLKAELDSYTEVALIAVLYDRAITGMTKTVVEAEGVSVGNFKNEKKVYPITCSNCGKQTTVPFKPSPNQRTPLLCIDCYNKKKGENK